MIFRYFFLLFCFGALTVLAQKSESKQTSTGLTYYSNADVDAINPEEYLNHKGEMFIASQEGFRLKVTKLNEQLEEVKTIDINLNEIEDRLTTNRKPERLLYLIGNMVCLVSKTSELKLTVTTVKYKVKFFDHDLNPLHEGWEPLSKYTHSGSEEKTAMLPVTIENTNPDQKAFQHLARLGNIYVNETGIISVNLSFNERAEEASEEIYQMTRFDSTGQKVYSTDVRFSRKNAPLYLIDIMLMDDGSMVYFFHQNGRPFFRIITAEGEELEEELDFETDEFYLCDIILNPDNTDRFMMIGYNTDLYLVAYYYSLSAFDDGSMMIPVPLKKTSALYVSAYQAEIRENKFYLAGIGWNGDYKKGWSDPAETKFIGAIADLTKTSLPVKELNQPAAEVIPDYIKTNGVTEAYRSPRIQMKPNTRSNLNGIIGTGNDILLAVKSYHIVYNALTTHDRGSFYYDAVKESGLFFDFEHEKISFKDSVLPINQFYLYDDQVLLYSFRKEKEKPNKNMAALYVQDFSSISEGQPQKVLYHLDEKVTGQTVVKRIGFYRNPFGKLFLYLKSAVLNTYIRVPLPGLESEN